MPKIVLDNVSLDFPIYDTYSRSFLRGLKQKVNVGGEIRQEKGRRASVLALNGLSFSLYDGDRVALLGHNGAGKSSLLKLLAGFYEPTSGTILRRGKVSALLNLTAGMDENISGFENIILCGLLRGGKRKELESKVEEIAEFSGLGPYLQMPVRLYSQGMMLRLAFSIFSSTQHEILLMDEWFGTGDANFIEKAKQRLTQLMFASSILVFATHTELVAREICNKGLYIEHGKILYSGAIDDVLDFQHHHLQSQR